MIEEARYRRLSAAIREVYAASLDDAAAWQGGLRAIADALDAGAAFVRIMSGGTQGEFGAVWGYSEADIANYQRNYAHDDHWTIEGHAKIIPGVPMTGDQLAPREKVLRSSAYNDFGRSFGFTDCIVLPVARRGADLSGVVVNGPGEDGLYRESHLELARLLTPHLQQAMLARRRLGGPTDKALGARLESLGVGLALFDGAGRLVWATSTFERLAEAARVFRSPGRAPFSEQSPAVRALIAGTLASGAGGSLAVRTETGAAVVIRCAPTANHPWLERILAREGVMVTLELMLDAARDQTLDAAAEHWALSRRERDFLHAAAAQRSIAKTAAAMGIAYETARTHAKRIYQKAGVHSLGELLTAAAAVPIERR